MNKYPKDCIGRSIGTRARAIFSYKINAQYWEYHEMTGTDHGTDMVIEYIENDIYTNNNIECQIKGTKTIEKYMTKKGISFPLEVKTINYALASSSAFILVLVDIISEVVYYLPIQDYFIANPKYFEKIENNQETVNLHITLDNTITLDNDFELREIAKSIYIKKGKREIIKMKKEI